MGAEILPITTGTLTVSPIRFYCTPSRANGTVVQLGAIAEIVVPKLRGLGLIARPDLTPFEMNAIGELGRRLLSSPFATLSKDFELAWAEAAPGAAISFLCARHSHSLRVEPPEARAVPHRLFVDAQPVRSLVRNFLSEVLDEEATALVALNGEETHIEEPEERVELKRAAA